MFGFSLHPCLEEKKGPVLHPENPTPKKKFTGKEYGGLREDEWRTEPEPTW